MFLLHSALVACDLYLLTGFISTQWQDIAHALLAHPKLLCLCEAESLSYLDEVASSPQSLDLAKSLALEVFDLLKTAFGRNSGNLTTTERRYPMGLLQLNAMRLADIFSDDSNFRSYMTVSFIKVLTATISLSHADFVSCWCSSSLPETEEDASVEYDIFTSVGWVLDNTSSLDLQKETVFELHLTPHLMPSASYAHHRTSLFVKVIANLHCFVPNVCVELERNLFILKVLECLQMDLSNLLPGFSFASDAPKAATVNKNLRSLLSHAESLIPTFLNEEDVQLLRVFFRELQTLISSTAIGENRVHTQDSKFEDSLPWDKFSKLVNKHYQDAQSTGGCSSLLQVQEPSELNKGGNLKEGMSENSAFPGIGEHNSRAVNTNNKGNNVNRQDQVEGIASKTLLRGAKDMDKDAQNAETSGSDTSSAKGKNVIENVDNGESKSKERFKKVAVGEIHEDEKVETVQRRKRKRTIMNDKQVNMIERALLDEPDMHRNAASLQSWADKLSVNGSEVTPSQLKNWLNNRKAKLARTAAAKDVRPDNSMPDKQRGPVTGSSGSAESHGPVEIVRCNVGQHVVLVDVRGEEIGKGKIAQVQGKWHGKSLEESETYVVDVRELQADKGLRLPYPSETTGTSFAEAETKLGVMRVLWDSRRILVRQSAE